MTSIPAPYEVPSKTEMRYRCEVAIDQAGHQMVDRPMAIALPHADIKGRVRGDLQSRDDDGVLYCYYIRSVVEDSLPQWLVDYGRHVRKAPNTKMIAVYEEVSADLEQSCTAAGVGLVVLTEDNRFEEIVDFDDVLPQELAEDIRERLKDARRSLQAKLDMQQASLNSRISQVAEITANMTDEMSANFMSNLETEVRRLEEWSVEISKRLDDLASNFIEQDLVAVQIMIDAGAKPADSEN